MAQSNADLVRAGYNAFSRGDLQTLASLFHADAVWHTPRAAARSPATTRASTRSSATSAKAWS
jgi:ketosteroid isomerase-like protein